MTNAELAERLLDIAGMSSRIVPEWVPDLKEAAAKLERVQKDAGRLDWIEEQHTLHKSVEFLYIVDGYEVQMLYDGNLLTTYQGKDLRAAIDTAIAAQESK